MYAQNCVYMVKSQRLGMASNDYRTEAEHAGNVTSRQRGLTISLQCMAASVARNWLCGDLPVIYAHIHESRCDILAPCFDICNPSDVNPL